MAPSSSASTHTSGSSHSSHSLRSNPSHLATSLRTGTIKPPKTPRTPRPAHILTQAFQTPQAHPPKSSARFDDPPSVPNTATVSGLRAQIHQLMPRHALFHVRVNIHQLASVPLVKGEFGIRWKFKKVKSPRENGNNKGKGKDDGHADSEEDDEHDTTDGGHMSVEASGDESYGHGNIPSVVISDSHRSSSTSASASAASSRPATPNPYAQYLTSDWLPQSYLSSHPHSFPHSPHPETAPSRSLSSTTPQDGYAPSRGMTPYLKLQEHNVVWEHTLNVVVQMDVNRDTTDLLPNELKLVVMQRVIPGDLDAPHNPRLGAVNLNLAEYVDVGPITRRYLLSQSKTNATLKLTIELEHIGGETKYKSPPLPKGEILGGVAGILDNDVYRTRPRTLDLYGMYYDTRGKGEKQHKGTTPNNWGDPFDMSNLSSAYGPRTTETLIEAIFNPVPSHSERESPFTYFVPLEHQGGKASPVSARSGNSDRRDRNGSVHSAATSSEYTDLVKTRSISSRSGHSLSSHGHSSEFGGGGGEEEKHRPWWRKIGTGSVGCSRPGTPVV